MDTIADRDVKIARIVLQYGKPKLYKHENTWWASTKGTCGGGYTPWDAYNMWLTLVTRKRKDWKAIPVEDRFLHRPFTNDSEGTRVVKLMPVII